MDEIVSSINHLVDSTVKAIEEERKIEKSKDELITNIGHDIRTPLTSVIGYLALQDIFFYSLILYPTPQTIKITDFIPIFSNLLLILLI